MKITLINGSPRRGNASSKVILDSLELILGDSCNCTHVQAYDTQLPEMSDLDADLMILAFPLYVDSLPSRLLTWLVQIQPVLDTVRKKRIARGDRAQGFATVANCGFHEGQQNKTALDILYNFASSSGLGWCGGLGIGTGEMIRELKDAPPLMFIKRPITLALQGFVSEMLDGVADDPGSVPQAVPVCPVHTFTHHAFPRFLYILAGHAGWKTQAKANGLVPRQILARPNLTLKN